MVRCFWLTWKLFIQNTTNVIRKRTTDNLILFWLHNMTFSFFQENQYTRQHQYLLFLGLGGGGLEYWWGRHEVFDVLAQHLVLWAQLQILLLDTIHSLGEIYNTQKYHYHQHHILVDGTSCDDFSLNCWI